MRVIIGTDVVLYINFVFISTNKYIQYQQNVLTMLTYC